MSKNINLTLIPVQGGFMPFHEQHEGEQRLVKRVLELRDCSVGCGAESPNGAVVYARSEGCSTSGFSGKVGTHSAVAALNDMIASGMTSNVTLAVSVSDNRSHAPLSDDVLEVLSKFDDATVLLVGDDRSVVLAKTAQALAA